MRAQRIDPWKLLERATERAIFNAESMAICLGHMTNAIIDLESGETKATAIRTLQRGLDLIKERNAPLTALADQLRGDAA